MLSKFSVSNFKSFDSKFSLDLKKNRDYQFNSESIKNGIINHSIIYGYNGTGKSNLGFAIFDIISHLTDFENNQSQYTNYLNALNDSEFAQFEYEFNFNGDLVNYTYKKTDVSTVSFEHLKINGKDVAILDRIKGNDATILLKGTETLNRNFTNTNLSVLKYIRKNAILETNKVNEIFNCFFKFIEGMLFFRSLEENMYLGLEKDSPFVMEDIIERGNVKNLEKFLNAAKIEAKIDVIESDFGKKVLGFNFNGTVIPLIKAASTGTRALILFYYWLQRINDEKKVSFVYLDEFDAYYHHTLAKLLVKELKNSGVQFILTTHNTSIISNELLRPDCYFQMDKKSIRSLAERTNKELREGHNIEKMYKSGSFHGQ